MRKSKNPKSSPPPEYLPRSIGISDGDGDGDGDGDPTYFTNEATSERSESYTSTGTSSSFLSITPPSQLSSSNNRGNNISQSQYNNVQLSPNSLSSRSLSASPVTPLKNWEIGFKGYFKSLRKHKNSQMDDSSTDTSDKIDKVALPDIMGKNKKLSSSLPPNYVVPPRRYTVSTGNASTASTASATGTSVIAPKVQTQLRRVSSRDKFDTLDASVKYGKATTVHDINYMHSSDEWSYLSGDSDHSSHHHSDEGMDKATRGGNVFGKMFGKKKRDGSGTRGASDDAAVPSGHSRRTKSCDSLLDSSVRGGSRIRSSSDEKKLYLSSNTKYGPTGTVIGPDGILRDINSKIDFQKEKKIVFTEMRNSANAKDSATAYLGEEKSVHKGKLFEPTSTF